MKYSFWYLSSTLSNGSNSVEYFVYLSWSLSRWNKRSRNQNNRDSSIKKNTYNQWDFRKIFSSFFHPSSNYFFLNRRTFLTNFANSLLFHYYSVSSKIPDHRCSIVDWLSLTENDSWRFSATKRKRTNKAHCSAQHGCTRILSTRERSDVRIRTSLPYAEPFSLIVKVKSPRVWDVICSTLVLYRSTPGLDRGVGVFKGDYTQRQGWLYWRSLPVALIRHAFFSSFQFFLHSCLLHLQFISIQSHVYRIFHTFLRKSARIKNGKIGKRGKTRSSARGRYVIENENCLGKLVERGRTRNRPPTALRFELI